MLLPRAYARVTSDCNAGLSSSFSRRYAQNRELAGWRHVVKSDEIDVLAPTVLRDLEEIDHTLETRRSSQLWSDIRETDRQDRIHLDLTLFHPVAVAHLYVRTHPYPDAASDVAAANSVAQALGEDHLESLLLAYERRNVREYAGRGLLSAQNGIELRNPSCR
jgi:hypothetical protein